MKSWRELLRPLLDHGQAPDLLITEPLQVRDWDRRAFLKLFTAAPLAATVDIEALIWTPKPIVIVGALPRINNPNLGAVVAAAWEEYVKTMPEDIFSYPYLLEHLK